MKFADEDRTGGALDEAEKTVAVAGADDCVHLPVADLGARFDGGGTFGDVALAVDPAAPFVGAVALAALEGLREVAPELATAPPIAPDVDIDRLVADRDSERLSQPLICSGLSFSASSRSINDQSASVKRLLRRDIQRRAFACSRALLGR